jgi:hypothetical protein
VTFFEDDVVPFHIRSLYILIYGGVCKYTVCVCIYILYGFVGICGVCAVGTGKKVKEYQKEEVALKFRTVCVIIDSVRYHSGGSMKLNACILIRTHGLFIT